MTVQDWSNAMEIKELQDIIQQNGVVGAGGAGFSGGSLVHCRSEEYAGRSGGRNVRSHRPAFQRKPASSGAGCAGKARSACYPACRQIV